MSEEVMSRILRMGFNSATIEMSMFASHGVWLLRTRAIRRRAKEAQVTYEDFPEAIEWQEKGMKLDLREIGRLCSKKNRDIFELSDVIGETS
jgi:hypothetical protein